MRTRRRLYASLALTFAAITVLVLGFYVLFAASSSDPVFNIYHVATATATVAATAAPGQPTPTPGQAIPPSSPAVDITSVIGLGISGASLVTSIIFGILSLRASQTRKA
jgi:hypothetical protein